MDGFGDFSDGSDGFWIIQEDLYGSDAVWRVLLWCWESSSSVWILYRILDGPTGFCMVLVKVGRFWCCWENSSSSGRFLVRLRGF